MPVFMHTVLRRTELSPYKELNEVEWTQLS